MSLGASMPVLRADVTLPALFSNHAVLQQAEKVPVWGTAAPGEEVSVSIDKQTVTGKADEKGKWKVFLNLKDVGAGPFTMEVKGKNVIALTDVVVGEVWVVSGQSNMDWPLANVVGVDEDISNSANPQVRQFHVGRKWSTEPLDSCGGGWVVADPKTVPGFTAVGYFFIRSLQKELKRPVGIIYSAIGGTPSEAWTSSEALDTIPELKEIKDKGAGRIRDYPADKERFIAQFEKWSRETGREDKPTLNPENFAGEHISTDDWVPARMPGEVKGRGLPANGVIWIRKEITVSPEGKGQAVRPMIGIADGYMTIYWNGERVGGFDYKFHRTGAIGNCAELDIPGKLVKEGRNVIAIRIYAPILPPKFSTSQPVMQPASSTSAMKISQEGNYVAKMEYELPPLSPEQLAAAPKPPIGDPVWDKDGWTIPTFLFNAMINPLIPYAIKGVIWYQGESNADRALQYRKAFPLMIGDWRKHWRQGDFPFYYCQLANYTGKSTQPEASTWAELREAQTMTLRVPNTGMAVLHDLGEAGNIHPNNKKDVGERLAKIALAKDYGFKISYSGPLYKSMKIEDDKIRISFEHVDGGLVAKEVPPTYPVKLQTNETAPLKRNSPNSQLEGFAICGEDRKWVWGDAKIEGEQVVVWSDLIPRPVAVRYAWAQNPTCNLYNAADLPASSFCTDDAQRISKDFKQPPARP